MLNPDAVTPPPGEDNRSALHLSWLEPPGMIALSFTNFFLRLITLGLYSFWGKTEVRRRLWSSIRLEGEPLQYLGTGKELFLGFLVIFGAILLPLGLSGFAMSLLFGPESPAQAIYSIAVYVLIFMLIGIGTYRAQRYRLSRTSWRSIRGGMEGSDVKYAWTYFWTALLMPSTLGWLAPWRSTELQKILTRDMRFGDRPFGFTAKPGPLYSRFAVLWFSGLFIIIAVFGMIGVNVDWNVFNPENFNKEDKASQLEVFKVIGIAYAAFFLGYLFYYIVSAWYRSKAINHFAAHTHFEGATFHSNVTGFGLVRVAVGNFFLNVLGWTLGLAFFFGLLSLAMAAMGPEGFQANEPIKFAVTAVGALLLIASAGLFAPVTQTRTMRYLVQNLRIDGTVSLDQIAQGAAMKKARGEGLAQAFDIDGF